MDSSEASPVAAKQLEAEEKLKLSRTVTLALYSNPPLDWKQQPGQNKNKGNRAINRTFNGSDAKRPMEHEAMPLPMSQRGH